MGGVQGRSRAPAQWTERLKPRRSPPYPPLTNRGGKGEGDLGPAAPGRGPPVHHHDGDGGGAAGSGPRAAGDWGRRPLLLPDAASFGSSFARAAGAKGPLRRPPHLVGRPRPLAAAAELPHSRAVPQPSEGRAPGPEHRGGNTDLEPAPSATPAAGPPRRLARRRPQGGGEGPGGGRRVTDASRLDPCSPSSPSTSTPISPFWAGSILFPRRAQEALSVRPTPPRAPSPAPPPSRPPLLTRLGLYVGPQTRPRVDKAGRAAERRGRSHDDSG